MQKLYILFFIQVQCSDCGWDNSCGWSDKFNGTFTDCDDSQLEKYFYGAQYYTRDPDVSWNLFEEN